MHLFFKKDDDCTKEDLARNVGSSPLVIRDGLKKDFMAVS